MSTKQVLKIMESECEAMVDIYPALVLTQRGQKGSMGIFNEDFEIFAQGVPKSELACYRIKTGMNSGDTQQTILRAYCCGRMIYEQTVPHLKEEQSPKEDVKFSDQIDTVMEKLLTHKDTAEHKKKQTYLRLLKAADLA